MGVYVKMRELLEERQNVWQQAKDVLLQAERERRGMTAEENARFERASEEMDRLDRERLELLASDEADRERALVNEEFRRVATPGERAEADRRDRQIVDFFRRGSSTTAVNVDLRPAMYASDAIRNGATGQELRVLQTDGGASGGSLTVPTVVESTVWSYFVSSNAMRRLPCTVVTRRDGAPYVVPRVNTHGIATQVASQTTAFAGTDPVRGNITLSAYDFGQLTAVSNDMLEDSGVDVLNFVAQEIGGSIGRLTSQKYITGAGSTEPTGIMTAVTGAGTIATGGSLIDPTYEKLIDLIYSVPTQYRARNGAFLMHDLTASTIRKIRDGAGRHNRRIHLERIADCGHARRTTRHTARLPRRNRRRRRVPRIQRESRRVR
jgi:HK97 family phage major capsid protein